MRCSACNAETRVLDTRTRSTDGATRRRRECVACGRRLTTEELPGTESWLGELPEFTRESGGPLEAVRRRAILASVRDENERGMATVVARMEATLAEMRTILQHQAEREEA